MDGFVGLSEHLENDPLTFPIAPVVGQGFYLSCEISQNLSDVPTDFGVPHHAYISGILGCPLSFIVVRMKLLACH